MVPTSFAVFSRPLAAIPHLTSFVGGSVELNPTAANDRFAGVLVWGERPTRAASRRALEFAQRHALPVLRLEDGFLRTLPRIAGHEPGSPLLRRLASWPHLSWLKRPQFRLSMFVDAKAAYFDARVATELETLIAQAGERARESSQLAAAVQFRAQLLQFQATKYAGVVGHCIRCGGDDLEPGYILVADQVAGDASLPAGLCSDNTFVDMLEAARDENPGLPVVIKAHPMVGQAGRCSALLQALQSLPAGRRAALLGAITWLASGTDPISAVRAARRVYVATSQLGFEALLAGSSVICFGAPWYCGWGLTDDRGPPLPADSLGKGRRKALCSRPVCLDHLVDAAYLRYARYVDPATGYRQSPTQAFEQWQLNAAMAQAGGNKTEGRNFFVGFPRWKRATMRAFSAAAEPRFVRSATGELRAGDRVHVWGHRLAASDEQRVRSSGATLVRIEDGFLRSVGLGSNFVAPLSLAFDTDGIYYDAVTPNGIERWLACNKLDEAMARRAAALRERIVSMGLTKYNLAATDPNGRNDSVKKLAAIRQRSQGRQILLVPGQVDSDASIVHGALHPVQTMAQLLQAVRQAHPQAYVIWRPHPEVVAGNRRGLIVPLSGLADELVLDVDTLALIGLADQVHVLTSLVGFDALLRGRKVVTYGQPFYAGWGLSTDLGLIRARPRPVSLDALVYASLIVYPRYHEPRSGYFMCAESALLCLQQRMQALMLTADGQRRALVAAPRSRFTIALNRFGRQCMRGLRWAARTSTGAIW